MAVLLYDPCGTQMTTARPSACLERLCCAVSSTIASTLASTNDVLSTVIIRTHSAFDVTMQAAAHSLFEAAKPRVVHPAAAAVIKIGAHSTPFTHFTYQSAKIREESLSSLVAGCRYVSLAALTGPSTQPHEGSIVYTYQSLTLTL